MKCNELYCLSYVLAACTHWQINKQQKESENTVSVWEENIPGIKSTQECSGWHSLQYSKEIPVPKYDHSAIHQDRVPDTPCGTVSASAAEKELCSCACLGDQLSSAG